MLACIFKRYIFFQLGLDFKKYTLDMMAMDGLGYNITEDEVIINEAPDYFRNLKVLLGKTDKK